MSRSEEILTAMLDGETTAINPQCRKEQFLKAIANNEGTANLPEPNCREEVLLKRLAEKGLDRPDQTKTINPSTVKQVVTPDTGYELGSVTVNAVTKEIDANIQASNIKNGVSILGVTGTLDVDKPNQTKTIAPSENEQIITADTGYELGSVTIKAAPLQEKTVTPIGEQQIITADSSYYGLNSVTVEAAEIIRNQVDLIMTGNTGGLTDEQATSILDGTYSLEGDGTGEGGDAGDSEPNYEGSGFAEVWRMNDVLDFSEFEYMQGAYPMKFHHAGVDYIEDTDYLGFSSSSKYNRFHYINGATEEMTYFYSNEWLTEERDFCFYTPLDYDAGVAAGVGSNFYDWFTVNATKIYSADN